MDTTGNHSAPASTTSKYVFPATFAQQRLWFLEQLQPGNPVYHLPTAVRVKGPLDVAAFEKTFAATKSRKAGDLH